MDPNRKRWNEGQQALRHALSRPENTQEAIELFLRQHAMVHSAAMAQSSLWSFEDEVWEGMSESTLRRVPPKYEHSVVWIIWHIARIEDITMNILAAGTPQVFSQGDWSKKLKVAARDTGNSMSESGVADLSATMDVQALRDYRQTVGRRTREVIRQLFDRPEQLKKKVDPSRLALVLSEGAVVESATGLIEYWRGLTITGLLLMPPTRHNFVHLNEAAKVKQKTFG